MRLIRNVLDWSWPSGALAVALLGVSAVASAKDRYSVDEAALPPAQQAAYIRIKQALDAWNGEPDLRERVGPQIDSFVAVTPGFLPIHIERARMTIMSSYVDPSTDWAAGNRQALAILGEVQKRDPRYAKAFVVAGHAHTNPGQYAEARKALARAEALGTTEPWLYLNLAKLEAATGNEAKAVEDARKGLFAAGDNPKAVVAAVEFLSKHASSTPQDFRRELVDLVFKHFSEPAQRLRIAERLMTAYRGEGPILLYAADIIRRQHELTPDNVQAKYDRGWLALKVGYTRTQRFVHRYSPQAIAEASGIFESLLGTEREADALWELFHLALARDDCPAAARWLEKMRGLGPAIPNILLAEAMLAHANNDLPAAAEALTQLDARRPGVASTEFMEAVLQQPGQREALNRIHLAWIARSPNDAWIHGNYAQFRLYKMDDPDGAIRYGEKALELMPYGIARNTTAIAYLAKAARHSARGERQSADAAIAKADALGYDPDYVARYCKQYCQDIQALGLPHLRNLGY